MPAGFTEALNWIFSALLTAANQLFSVWLFQLFLSLGILALVWKIYNLLRYSGSSSDFQEWLDNNYQGALNPGQSGANQQIQDNVGQLENFDNQIFTDVSDYTSQLDFGLGDWSEAAAGISYIGSIFMLIWDNSPTQVIVLSLMVGLCLLILGRGPRVAGEVRRHEERASRRKKGG